MAIEMQARPLVVLDTNVVLDWLVFADARCNALARQIEAGSVLWLATPRMRDELQSVLPRPALQRWLADAQRVLARFDQHVRRCPAASSDEPATPRCADPDDQPFVDLACRARARWLFSRDRAVLGTAAQARRFGVTVLKPEDCRELLEMT